MQKILFFLIYLLCFATFQVNAQEVIPEDKIATSLKKERSDRQTSKYDIHVVLSEQFDFNQWTNNHDRLKTPFDTRAVLLHKDLKSLAQSTQASLLEFLETHPGVEKNSVKSHWIANAISCRVSYELIRDLSLRRDVRWIGENVLLAQEYTECVSSAKQAPDAIEKGLAAINAPAMWALGYTGYGQIAFTADTGVDPTHPAISNQYNGLYRSPEASWYAWELSNTFGSYTPFDCSNHGTHVTGTILGLDRQTNDTIGVAFNSTWIGGAILCGVGTEDNIDAFEWALNPDGNEDTSDDIPDVINNSWYDPSLDTLDCYSVYVPVLQALEAAGVAVVFSAGNAGPDPMTITQPHNINVNEVNSFTIGALNGNTPAYPIASFSSIGPSHCDGEGSLKIKPEVSAPGVQVRSCVPGNEYALLNGTSMAAPHVSGAILLLKEAFPYLGGKDLKLALYHSCTDLGEPGEDNTFGMGIINVYAAYLYLIEKGHVPVDPKLKNDVMLLDLQHADMGCDGKIAPYIWVENAGTDTLKALDIAVSSNSFADTFKWTGILAPLSRIHMTLGYENFPLGKHEIKVELLHPNGSEDLKNLNNSKSLVVTVTERTNKEAIYLFNGDVCQKSTIVLTSPVQKGKNQTTLWYDQAIGGEQLFSGNHITVSAAQLAGGLYADIVHTEYSGLTRSSGAEAEDKSNAGMLFEAVSDFTLKSVKVYAEKTGPREFFLYNDKGEIEYSAVRLLNKVGENTVKLDWKIEAGREYRLIKKVGRPLLAEKTVVPYPIILKDVLIIKGGDDNGVLTNDYKYFYDWEIAYSEPCGRIPYKLNVRQDSTLAQADFSLSADTISFSGGALIQPVNLSSEAKDYFWDMGDGTTYASRDIEHNYLTPGLYDITLKVTDSLNCVTGKSKKLLVLLEVSGSNDEILTQENLLQFTMYPNPAGNFVTVQLLQKNTEKATLEMVNVNGQILKKYQISSGMQEMQIPVHDMPNGVYLVRLFAENAYFMPQKLIIR